jgi:hypothetical protein
LFAARESISEVDEDWGQKGPWVNPANVAWEWRTFLAMAEDDSDEYVDPDPKPWN